jgi:hypothetical protein
MSRRKAGEWMHRFFALAFLISALTARVADAQLDPRLKTPEVVVTSTFMEFTAELRKFPRWKRISGDNPAVVKHDASTKAYGGGFNFGQKLGSLPVWVTIGGFYVTGLGTNTTLATGTTIHGSVDNVGAGAGLRLVAYEEDRSAVFMWAMGFHEWDNGDFEIVHGETVTETRIHKSWSGDYGVGAVYLLGQRVGIDYGVGYNGQFNKKNADEALRIYVGLHLNISGIDH